MYVVFFKGCEYINSGFPNKQAVLEWCYKQMDLTRPSSNPRELSIMTWLSFDAEFKPDKFKLKEVFSQLKELRNYYVVRMSRNAYNDMLTRNQGADYGKA